MNSNEEEVDQKLVNKMYGMVRVEEANNLKTGKYTDAQMVSIITQIIQSVLKEEKHEI